MSLNRRPATNPAQFRRKIRCDCRVDGTGNRSNVSVVLIKAWGNYPFTTGSPDIDYDVAFAFERRKDGTVGVRFVGWHDAFPAYEIIINGQIGAQHYPEDAGPGILNLYGYKTVNFAGSTTLVAPN
jgi:hypothetical protein